MRASLIALGSAGRMAAFFLILGGVAAGLGADRSAAAETPQTVAALIEQLDDDQYAVRLAATRRLGQAGLAAVEPLTRAAQGAELEVAFRALEALGRLAYSADESVEDAAFGAMLSLAGTDRPTARRAAASLEKLRGHYQARAKERLQTLGASFDRDGLKDGQEAVIVGGGAMIVRGRVLTSSDVYLGMAVTIDDRFKGTASDLRLLGRLANVDRLLLSGERITDDWLAEIKALTTSNLRHLELRRTKITDAGLAHLASIASLTNIDIMHTPVTDEAAATIGGMKGLRYVKLYGTKVTAAAARRLEGELPDARIDRRGGALLGVGGSISEQPCVISTVQPDSAASRAGIQIGDAILKFDGKPVKNFTELTAAIAEKGGGETVELEILRAAALPDGTIQSPTKPVAVKVTLGEW